MRRALSGVGAGLLLLGSFGCEQRVVLTDPPSEFKPPLPDPPVTLTEVEVGQALPAALAQVFEIDPELLYGPYDSLRLQLQDTPIDPTPDPAPCPEYDDPAAALAGGPFTWNADFCTAGSSAVFDGGISSFSDPPGLNTDDPNNPFFVQEHKGLDGGARIFEANGNSFQVSLNSEYFLTMPAQGSSDVTHDLNMSGVVFSTDPAFSGSWISRATHFSTDFNMEATDEVSTGSRFMHLDGGISGLAGTFEALNFNFDANLNSDGTKTFDGQILARDTNGIWYTLNLFGVDLDASFVGCGSIFSEDNDDSNDTSNSNPIQVCSDFSRLLTWSGRSW